jgi:hypothetical protein
MVKRVQQAHPEREGVLLDAEIYRLASQRGNPADGIRLIQQSSFALRLADPELVRAYVAEVIATTRELERQFVYSQKPDLER